MDDDRVNDRNSTAWNADCSTSAMGVFSVLVMVAGCLGVLGLSEARAQAYEWLDEHGMVKRSDTLPPDGTAFRELRVIEGSASATPMTALERRTLEIINQQALMTQPMLPLPTTAPGSGMFVPAPDEQSSLALIQASSTMENVRDPCLLSWDPRCHEKHMADYDARWGYAPSLLRSHRQAAPQNEPVQTPQ